MKKAYIAKLNMAQTCLAMIHASEHAASQRASSKSWQETVCATEAVVQSILEASQTLDRSKGISVAGRNEAREQLGDCAWAIASSLHALAVARGLPDLAAATDFTRLHLTRGTATAILNRCTDIFDWATDHLTMLAADNVTKADVAALQGCLEAFRWKHTWPREMRVAGRAASEQLDVLFGELAVLFEHRLDRLAVKFKRTAPGFHEAYWAARVLVHPATSKARGAEVPETVEDRGGGEAQPQQRHPDRSASEDREPGRMPRACEPQLMPGATGWMEVVPEGVPTPLISHRGGWSSAPARSGASVPECGRPMPLSMPATNVEDGFNHGWARLNPENRLRVNALHEGWGWRLTAYRH